MRHRTFCSTSDEGSWTSDSDVCSGNCCICGSGYSSDWEWKDTRCQDCNQGKSEKVRKRFRPSCERLHRAIKNHDCRTIRLFLEDGMKPCTTGPINCFILARKLKFILKKFLDIERLGANCQDSRGLTMLMLSEDGDIFKLLCKYKPDINIMNNDGDNIFFYLLKSHHRTFHTWQLEKLLELGLDVNSISSQGETAMVLAIREGVNDDTIEKLLKAGATPPPPFKDGQSIVTHPIQNNRLDFRGKMDFLDHLMELGIDVNAKDIDGRNAMYYIIQEKCKLLSNFYLSVDTKWVDLLEYLLIELLEKNCEVQGLCLSFERGNIRNGRDYSYVEKLDIIGIFARYVQSTKFLEQLVNRGLYDWKANIRMHRELFPGTRDPMSPLTAYLTRLYTHPWMDPNFKKMLKRFKYFISIGVDPAHRSLDRNFQLESSSTVRERGTCFSDLADELIYPDALFFVAQMKAVGRSNCNVKEESAMQFEEVLRMLVSFWPYPPLFMILLRVGLEVWELQPITRSEFHASKDLTLMTRLLIKIGGAVPLGTRYYKALKTLLGEIAENNQQHWPQIFDSFLKLDDGIPTLRSLSRAAFRATVKKTCPTGLDFSEYRVLCQGEMVPIPPDIDSYLQFNPTKAS